MAKLHSSGEETLWHNGRTCSDSGLHCGIGSHCLTDSCRENEEEEEEEQMIIMIDYVFILFVMNDKKTKKQFQT